MKKFEIIKTIQLILFIALTVTALLTVFSDSELYQTIASDPHVRLLSLLLWIALGLSFLFMFFDFGSYTDLKRENIELDQAVYADALTGVANRYSCDAYLSQYQGRPLPKDMGCITLDLTSLQEINEKEGHEGGDLAIRSFSDILTTAGEPLMKAGGRASAEDSAQHRGCFIGRNGGNKFLVIIRSCTEKKLEAYLTSVHQQVEELNRTRTARLTYTAGSALAAGSGASSLTALVALSDHLAMLSQEQAQEQSREQNPQQLQES